jgi:hypothetical protein
MPGIRTWPQKLVLVLVATVLFVYPSNAQSIVFSVDDTSAQNSTVVGRFTPTQYIPAFSSLVVTLAGSNVFPAGSTTDQAHVKVSPAQTGDKNIRLEKFGSLTDGTTFRDQLLNNANYQSNTPLLTTFESEITHLQTQEDHFGLRWTGAFCPTESGNYNFVLHDVDDFFEFWIGDQSSNSWTHIMSQIGGETDFPSATRPLRRTFNMDKGKIYPFIAIFVEGSQNDFLSFKWQVPRSDPLSSAAIPPSAFCTGWSYFNNSVLTIYSPFAMAPGVEVTFTIPSLPNPLCPRPNGTQVSSAILVPQIPLMNSVSSSIQSASSGSYPDRTVPSSSLQIAVGKIGFAKVLNISFTSPVRLDAPFALTVTLSGQAFAFSGQSVVFISPAGSSATAAVSQSPLVLTVQVQSFGAGSGVEYVPAHTPVVFTFGNLTYSVPGEKVGGIPSSILGGDGRCLATSSSGVLAAIPRSQWAFMCGAASNGWSCDQ